MAAFAVIDIFGLEFGIRVNDVNNDDNDNEDDDDEAAGVYGYEKGIVGLTTATPHVQLL